MNHRDDYHGGDTYLGSTCCQWHHFQYILKKSIWKYALKVQSWPHHVTILLTDEFHVIQRKSELIKKNIPILILFERFRQRENIVYSICDHVLAALIPIIFDGDLWISFSSNSVKIKRACILWVCLLYFPLIIGGNSPLKGVPWQFFILIL